MVTAKVNLSR
uniref:Nucleoid-associated protein At2g24020ic-like n=1 Tax=Rhizophora mucronata TaxID=61149 RepID=A0A2P2IYE8_RHIMU